jgi:hypothetical protein
VKIGVTDVLVALAYVPMGALLGAIVGLMTGNLLKPNGRRVAFFALLCGGLVFGATLAALSYGKTGAP